MSVETITKSLKHKPFNYKTLSEIKDILHIAYCTMLASVLLTISYKIPFIYTVIND